MMLKKFNVLSSYALAMAVTLFVALISGCDRRDEVYPVEGNAYVKDPAYLAQLDRQDEARDGLRKNRLALSREFDALMKKMNGDFAAVTNTPRGAELLAAIARSEALIVSNRMETAGIIRERKLRALADSERIRRGEAKAIDISKKEEK